MQYTTKSEQGLQETALSQTVAHPATIANPEMFLHVHIIDLIFGDGRKQFQFDESFNSVLQMTPRETWCAKHFKEIFDSHGQPILRLSRVYVYQGGNVVKDYSLDTLPTVFINGVGHGLLNNEIL